MFERYKPFIISAFDLINTTILKNDKLTNLMIYGELFGGGYDKDKLSKDMVQTEILYCSHIDFI